MIPAEELASQKQIDYIHSLIRYNWDMRIPVPLYKRKASEIIQELLAKKAEVKKDRQFDYEPEGYSPYEEWCFEYYG